MPTIQADVSLIAVPASSAPAGPRRLPRLAGWMLTAMVGGALWYGLIAIVRLAL